MATQYSKGVAQEYRCVNELKKMGALDARRTAGSHGPYDVIAIFSTHIILAQVKSGNAQDDVEKLTSLQVPPNVVKQLWHWVGRWIITDLL